MHFHLSWTALRFKIGFVALFAMLPSAPAFAKPNAEESARKEGLVASMAAMANDYAVAAVHYATSCNAGSASSCSSLAGYYHDGQGVAQDKPRAAGYYEKACSGGYEYACNKLGRMYEHGDGIAQDLQKAAFLYDKICTGGDPYGCTDLGQLYEHGQGVVEDKMRAAALYKRACDGRDDAACKKLAALGTAPASTAIIRRGTADIASDEFDAGAESYKVKNFAVAAQHFANACTGGVAGGCFELGRMYFSGDGVAQDKQRGALLYEKACTAGVAEGCNNLGVKYEHGEGVTQNKSQAAALYDKACTGGVVLGCNNLGGLYYNGEGVAQNYDSAIAQYRKALAIDPNNEAARKNLEIAERRGK